MKNIIRKFVIVPLLLLLTIFVIQVGFASSYSKKKARDDYFWNNLSPRVWVNVNKKVNDDYFNQYPKNGEIVLVFVNLDGGSFGELPFRFAKFDETFGFFLMDGGNEKVIEWMKIDVPPERNNSW